MPHEDPQDFDSYSWSVHGNAVAVKRMDKSAFVHRGTGIPVEVRGFFGVTNLPYGERYGVLLRLGEQEYEARI